MKIYIAARFSRRPEAHALAKALIAKGHSITSRWVKPDSDHVTPTGLSAQAADAERTRFAVEDLEDVRAADCVVSLMESPRSNSRGGRHVEFGIGLGFGHRQVVIGPRETVFHHLPEIEHFESVEEFLGSIAAATSVAPAPAVCTLGMECKKYGTCYAAAVGEPYMCGMPAAPSDAPAHGKTDSPSLYQCCMDGMPCRGCDKRGSAIAAPAAQGDERALQAAAEAVERSATVWQGFAMQDAKTCITAYRAALAAGDERCDFCGVTLPNPCESAPPDTCEKALNEISKATGLSSTGGIAMMIRGVRMIREATKPATKEDK